MPADILKKILARKAEELAALAATEPLSALEKRAREPAGARLCRRLAYAHGGRPAGGDCRGQESQSEQRTAARKF